MTADHSRFESSEKNRIIAEARIHREKWEQTYRAKALKLFPWVCGRCGREFSGRSLRELTVHHRDHNHDNNPPDGSNWELLCLYCHENEHSRYEDAAHGEPSTLEEEQKSDFAHKPFADLDALLKDKKGP